MSDKDDLIVAGVNQKDKGIWRDFYNRYYAALCSYVEKILFLTDAVEDLVQEVFISVWEGKRTFSDSVSWLIIFIVPAIIMHCCISATIRFMILYWMACLRKKILKTRKCCMLWLWKKKLSDNFISISRSFLPNNAVSSCWELKDIRGTKSHPGWELASIRLKLRKAVAINSYARSWQIPVILYFLLLSFIKNRAVHPCFCGGEVTVMWLI